VPRLALATALALVVAACGMVSTTRPPPTPADFPGMAGEFGERGVRISGIVSGDPGCEDQDLGRTAIRFTARGQDQVEPVTLYVYIFRNRDAWERRRTDVAMCARSWVTDPAAYRSIEASPFVLAGQGPWAPRFAAELKAALIAAAGTGG
jgi:hypothetical protein